MQNLVSKSPIQRFKLGNMILKAYNGNKIIIEGKEYWRGGDDWYYRPVGGTGMTRVPYTNKRFYSSIPRGAVANSFEAVKNYTKNSNKKTNHFFPKIIDSPNTTHTYLEALRLGYRPNPDGSWKAPEKKTNVNLLKTNTDQQKLNNLEKTNNNELKTNKLKTNNSLQSSVTKSTTKSITNPTTVKSVTKPKVIKPHFLSKYENYMDKRGITPDLIIEWQNKLKEYYDPNAKYKLADGIWGHDTEVAYNNYMNAGGAGLPTSLLKEYLLSDLARQYNPTSLIDISTPTLTDFTPQLRTKTFNKSEVRDYIRSKGKGAYDYTGAQRRALRMVLNGQGTDEDRAIVLGMGLFKTGGQLVSRNPIKRFKNGGVLKFLKAGNLPTAPKAEDRYRNGYKYGYRADGSLYLFPNPLYTIADIKGIRTDYPFMSNLGEIKRTIFYAGDNPIDTIYTETPNSVFPVKRKLRYADSKNKTSEYETLKRRFNTAWNLAK